MPPAWEKACVGESLRGLLLAARADAALQRSLATASSLAELVERARAAGYAISVRDLQLWAHHPVLEAGFWPWASLAPDQRLLFFRRG
jgi:hypothetical protein